MNNLITSIANWLTNSHNLEMPWWMWILIVPISLLTLTAIFYALLWMAFVRSFRPW